MVYHSRQNTRPASWSTSVPDLPQVSVYPHKRAIHRSGSCQRHTGTSHTLHRYQKPQPQVLQGLRLNHITSPGVKSHYFLRNDCQHQIATLWSTGRSMGTRNQGAQMVQVVAHWSAKAVPVRVNAQIQWLPRDRLPVPHWRTHLHPPHSHLTSPNASPGSKFHLFFT